MSMLLSRLEPSSAPTFDTASCTGSPEGGVCTLEQAAAGRWFSVDVLVIPASRHLVGAERAIVVASRAAGPVALAFGFLIPVVALLR